jgi:HEAT repeat protein
MPKESLETLIAELAHEEDWRRMRATAACLAGGPKAVDALIHAVETGPDALKIEAAGMLARLKDPRGGVALVRLLNEAEPAVRKAGAVALEQMAGVLDEGAAAALAEELHRQSDDEHRGVIVGLLGVIPKAIGPLSAMLKHHDDAVRLTAGTILEHLLDPRSADALVDVMTDPALRDVAVRTLKKLSAIRSCIDEAFERLRGVEEPGEREQVRMDVVQGLLAIGRPSVEILIDYLRDDDWIVREAAADLLGKIGDVRAVDGLMERLRDDKDAGVKELAIKALGLIGDARAADLLLEAIPIRPLRIFAVEALAKIKDVEVLRPHEELFQKLKTDRDGLVAYNSGVIVDKLAAAAQAAVAVESEGREADE